MRPYGQLQALGLKRGSGNSGRILAPVPCETAFIIIPLIQATATDVIKKSAYFPFIVMHQRQFVAALEDAEFLCVDVLNTVTGVVTCSRAAANTVTALVAALAELLCTVVSDTSTGVISHLKPGFKHYIVYWQHHHGHAAWSYSLDMQLGQAVQTCRMDMQHELEALACRMDMPNECMMDKHHNIQHGKIAWTCSIDRDMQQVMNMHC